jgi:hypothetical protein
MNDELALLAALQRDIAARLKPVCNGLSEASFDQLVRDIAAVKLKYGVESELSASLRLQLEQLVAEAGCEPDSRTTDELSGS